MTAKGEYFPKRTRQYVPEMHFSADVADSGFGTIEIPHAAAGGVVVVDGAYPATGGGVFLNVNAAGFVNPSDEAFAKFGRNLLVTSNKAVVIRGLDYLGQPVIENVAIGTDVATKKCFAFVDGISCAEAATVKIVTGDVLGLPYAMVTADRVQVDDVNVALASAGTFVPYTNAAQTATTAEPRGTFAPATAHKPDGAKSYKVHAWWLQKNLHGNAHFAG